MLSSHSFTVEQVELIRRLRNSGITHQQVIDAFQAYDRLENELGSIYSVPVSETGKNSGISTLPINSRMVNSSQHSSHNSSQNYKHMETQKADHSVFYQHLDQSSHGIDRLTALLMGNNKDSFHEIVSKFVGSNPSFDAKLQALEIGVGEMAMCHFLSGDIQSIDPSEKLRLLDWFMEKLKDIDSISEDFSQLVKFQGYSEGLDVHFVPRRERFTFREKHLEVLERFFKLGQYPSQEEKEHIANECNIAMATEAARELGEKEKLTHVHVATWFSNRRKEIKRLAKKDGINTERVILPSRVKPRFSSHFIPNEEFLEEHPPAVTKLSPSVNNVNRDSNSDSSVSQDSVLNFGPLNNLKLEPVTLIHNSDPANKPDMVVFPPQYSTEHRPSKISKLSINSCKQQINNSLHAVTIKQENLDEHC